MFLSFTPFEINYFRFASNCFKLEGKKINKGAYQFIEEFKLARGALQGFND